MDSDLQALKNLIDTVMPLPEADWQEFSKFWTPFTAGRKEILTEQGQQEKHIYFVLEGVQRVYFYDEQGREATLVFTYAPSFGGVLDAMLTQTKSRYWYQTLTPSRFLRAPYADIDHLRQSSPSVSEFMHRSLGSVLSGILERMTEMQCFSSEDKFRALLTRSPHILQQVPHKYLANYLGIDPTNFSKLINKIIL